MFGRYKFLNSNAVKFVMEDETIKVSRQSLFREKYKETGDEWIGDPLEGHSDLGLSRIIKDTNKDRAATLAARKMGFEFDSCYGVTINNARSNQVFDEFIYCVSYGEFSKLSRSMCEASVSNKDPYDACLELVDVNLLHKLVQHKAYYSLPPYAPFFRPIWHSDFLDVEYVDGIRDAMQADHSPLVKRTIFSEQSEQRMLVRLGPQVWKEALCVTLYIPGLKKCFKRVK